MVEHKATGILRVHTHTHTQKYGEEKKMLRNEKWTTKSAWNRNVNENEGKYSYFAIYKIEMNGNRITKRKFKYYKSHLNKMPNGRRLEPTVQLVNGNNENKKKKKTKQNNNTATEPDNDDDNRAVSIKDLAVRNESTNKKKEKEVAKKNDEENWVVYAVYD